MKREYRGQRSVAAIADFIRQQQVDPVKEINSMEEVKTLDVSDTHGLQKHCRCYIFMEKKRYNFLFHRGAREMSSLSSKKGTLITTTLLKKSPTYFVMTARSWLPLGEILFILDLSSSVAVCLNISFHYYRAVSEAERFSGDNVIYKPVGESVPDMVYLGSLSNFDLTYAWTQDKCVPLVREITFENGEVCDSFKKTFFIEVCLLDLSSYYTILNVQI